MKRLIGLLCVLVFVVCGMMMAWAEPASDITGTRIGRGTHDPFKVKTDPTSPVDVGAKATPAFSPMVHATDNHDKHDASGGLLRAVRDATRDFRDVRVATGAGYASLGFCVTGPERGAMGVHYANSTLVGDGLIDASTPELLIYEQRGSQLFFVGVEFLVLADQWNASHPDGEPPVLMGQAFQFVSSPNRYRLPNFYELHVWAWKDNQFGTFVDWNPDVSCADFTDSSTH